MSEPTTLTWVPVAFVRQTTGRMHVLFSLDLGTEQQFEGEPVLLVDHRPGDDVADIAFEPADVVDAPVVAALEGYRTDFAACLDRAHRRDGSFEPDLLLEQRVRMQLTP